MIDCMPQFHSVRRGEKSAYFYLFDFLKKCKKKKIVSTLVKKPFINIYYFKKM